jgi:hypothetical protein
MVQFKGFGSFKFTIFEPAAMQEDKYVCATSCKK